MENKNIEIDEVSSKGFDKRVRSLLSDKIYHLINNIDEGKITEFKLASGNIVSLKCEAIKNNVYVFSVVNDDSKAFKKWEILSIKINSGNGVDDTSDYKSNTKIISTQDNGVTFDLIFDAAKKSGLKDKFKLNKIKEVKLSSDVQSNTEEPKEDEKSNTEEPKEDEKSNEQKLKKDGEKSLAYMLKDPILKKAFYEQPTLWNLFVAELSGKKAKGKGIITVSGLIKNYDDKKSANDLKAKFIKDEEIWFVPMDIITLKETNGDSVNLTRDNKNGYKTISLGKELAEGPKMEGDFDGFKYIIEITSRLRDENYGYKCIVSVIRENGKIVSMGEKRIIILTKKSKGFIPNKG